MQTLNWTHGFLVGINQITQYNKIIVCTETK